MSRMSRKRVETGPKQESAVWVSWQSAEGDKNTAGELQALNHDGFTVLRVSGAQTMWIPIGRIYSISTKLNDIAEVVVLEEQAAAQANAVIDAVANDRVAE